MTLHSFEKIQHQQNNILIFSEADIKILRLAEQEKLTCPQCDNILVAEPYTTQNNLAEVILLCLEQDGCDFRET